MPLWRKRSKRNKPTVASSPDLDLNRVMRALGGIPEIRVARTVEVIPPNPVETHALTLANLAVYQSAAGNNDKALSIQMEVVETWRKLAADGSDEHKHYLAGNLANLGTYLFRQGRKADALAVVEEAAEIHRELCRSHFAEYATDFARALSNLSIHRSFLSRPQEDVLAPLEESVEIRRKLAELNPAAHRVDLANSLAVASASYLSFGRVSDATAAAQEAVALSRETGRSDAASQAILALSLWALAQAQAAGAGPTRAVQEALDCAREAAQIYQQLSNGHDPYADHLASVLSMTACALLIKLNRADEARQIQGLVRSGAIKEAIAILK